jgi:hypothetical protein
MWARSPHWRVRASARIAQQTMWPRDLAQLRASLSSFKAREFDIKDAAPDPDAGSNPADDHVRVRPIRYAQAAAFRITHDRLDLGKRRRSGRFGARPHRGIGAMDIRAGDSGVIWRQHSGIDLENGMEVITHVHDGVNVTPVAEHYPKHPCLSPQSPHPPHLPRGWPLTRCRHFVRSGA